MFTQVRSADRRVAPVEGQNHKSVMKAVYVVLEPQYQNSLTQAATALNAAEGDLGIDLCGYLIEELRDPVNYENFKRDVSEADVFIASLIFIEDLAQKVVEAVAPHRDRLKAAVVFPSMPEVMRLNKLGSFSMAQLGQSKSAIAGFMKKAGFPPPFAVSRMVLPALAGGHRALGHLADKMRPVVRRGMDVADHVI